MKALLGLCCALGLAAVLLWLRLDAVSLERDHANQTVDAYKQANKDLKDAVAEQKALAERSAKNEQDYQKGKDRAEQEAESLRACLANGTCGLYVAATCPGVPVDGAGANTSQLDAGAATLTPAAQRAYPTLVAGIKTQREQIVSLQRELKNLHAVCKLAR